MTRALIIALAFLVSCSGTGSPPDGGDLGGPTAADALDTLTEDGVALDAGGDDAASETRAPDTSAPDTSSGCPTTFAYAPTTGALPGPFPDDLLTEVAPESPSGLRVAVSETWGPWLESLPPNLAAVYTQLDGLDGFGTTAEILLPFDGRLGTVPDAAVQVLALDGEPAEPVPVDIELLDEGRLLALRPRLPLRPLTRYGVVVTNAVRDVTGGCVAPGSDLASLLDGSAADESLARLIPGYQGVLERAELAPEDLSAALVFTTQSVTSSAVAVADDIRTRTFGWETPPTCTDRNDFRHCEGTFEAHDYRAGAGEIDVHPTATYEVPVSLWLPLDAPPPWPVVVFGHGAGETRTNGGYLARHIAPLGLAVVAVDAVGFGDHPTSDVDDTIENISTLMGLDLDAGTLDAHVLRANLRQTAFDKLQLLRLVATAPDLDGDDIAELDPTRLGYAGFSLGGVTAGEVLAGADLDIVVLSVTGARLSSIIDSGIWRIMVLPQIVPATFPAVEVRRFLSAVQTVADSADSANFAPYVLGDRLPGAGATPPHVLFDMALGDTYMPNAGSLYYARALGVPQLAPVLLEVGGVPVLEGPVVQGNLGDGSLTAALFQFDRVTAAPGEAPAPAGHDSTPVSLEGVLQVTHFFETWLDGGVPEIIDPYDALDTPPLP